MFIPVLAYIGDAEVQLGLYSTRDQRRLTLAGEDAGQQSYKVATLSLLPHSENVFLLFKDGWHPAEVAARQHDRRVAVVEEGRRRCRSGTRRRTSCSTCTPTTPRRLPSRRAWRSRSTASQVDTIAVTPRQEFLHKTRITAAQLGDGRHGGAHARGRQDLGAGAGRRRQQPRSARARRARLPRLCRTGLLAAMTRRVARCVVLGLTAVGWLPGRRRGAEIVHLSTGRTMSVRSHRHRRRLGDARAARRRRDHVSGEPRSSSVEPDEVAPAEPRPDPLPSRSSAAGRGAARRDGRPLRGVDRQRGAASRGRSACWCTRSFAPSRTSSPRARSRRGARGPDAVDAGHAAAVRGRQPLRPRCQHRRRHTPSAGTARPLRPARRRWRRTTPDRARSSGMAACPRLPRPRPTSRGSSARCPVPPVAGPAASNP